MEIRFDKKTLRNLILIVLGVILVYWFLHDADRVTSVLDGVWSIFSPFIIGAVLAFILNVPMRAFERMFKKIKKIGIRRAIALLLTLICFLLVLGLVFLLLIPELLDTGENLFYEITKTLTTLEVEIEGLLAENPDIMEFISEYVDLKELNWGDLAGELWKLIEEGLSKLLPQTFTVIGDLASSVFNAFISVSFAIYALFQKETLARQGRKVLYAIFPVRVSDYIVRVMRLSNATFSNFLSGQCLEVCILGLMFAITMTIFGMPYIPVISVLVAVTAFIPVVGAWVGCIIGAFLILASNLSDPLIAVWFVLMFVVLQQLENNFIYPRVVGTSIGLSGMWVLIAVALGGAVGGVAGMFLMIPVVSVLYTLTREWVHKRLQKKQIPAEKFETPENELLNYNNHIHGNGGLGIKKLFKRKKKKS